MITCPIALSAEQFPEALAVITQHSRWTYREFDLLVAKAAQALIEQGVLPEQRVAFYAQKDWQSAALLFALWRCGAVACPLNPKFPSAYIERLDAHHFLSFSLASSAYASKTLQEEQHATLLFTSGSTGTPKIACNSFGNYLYSALGANTYLNLSSGDRWLLSLPLYHVGGIGILMRCFLSASTVAFCEEGITHLSLVPTQLYRLLKEDYSHLTKMKAILLGGAPLSLKLYEGKGLPLFPTYGMTEMSSLITLGGTLLPYRELKLAEDGEILVRGKTLFQGYWDKGLALPLDDEGWFATKDLARPPLTILGRKDNLFISGGENIQPEEIERLLCEIPGIAEAVVIPLPDEEFGARPAAFVRDETQTHTLESIREALKGRLPSYKMPIRLLPLNHSQSLKVNRRDLTLMAQKA